MTAEQILKEIEALPKSERERLVQRMRESGSSRSRRISSTPWRISIISGLFPWKLRCVRRHPARELHAKQSEVRFGEGAETRTRGACTPRSA
jgi:hypothetical protein